MEIVSLNCNTCGADLEHIKDEQYKCNYCGGKRQVKDGNIVKELKISGKPSSSVQETSTPLVSKKTKIKNKKLAIILSFILVPMLVFAAVFGGIHLFGGNNDFQLVQGLNFRRIGEEYEVFLYGEFAETTLTIPAERNGRAVTTIAYRAFEGYSQIRDVLFPSSITTINAWAFYGMTSLINLNLPASLTAIEQFAFSGTTNLSFFTLDAANTHFRVIDQNLYTADGAMLIQYAIARPATNFIVPQSVTTIGAGAFYGAINLTAIILPNGLTEIADKAFFNNTNLATINIPNTINHIGELAFANSTSLANIFLPQNIARLENNVFYGAKNVYIFTEMPFRPAGWQVDWNPNDRPVKWNARRQVARTIDPSITHTIMFNLNGGEGTAPPNQTVTAVERIEFPPIPTRSGHLFVGWFDNPSSNSAIFDFTQPVTESLRLYAHWTFLRPLLLTPNTVYSVSDIGITGRNQQPTRFHFMSSSKQYVTVTANKRQGSSLNFHQFNIRRTVGAITTLRSGNAPRNASFSFLAETGATYSIELGRGDGTFQTRTEVLIILSSVIGGFVETITSTNDLIVGQNFTIALPQARVGYRFMGWFSEENGQGTQFTDEDGNSLAAFNETNDIDLYAYFVSI